MLTEQTEKRSVSIYPLPGVVVDTDRPSVSHFALPVSARSHPQPPTNPQEESPVSIEITQTAKIDVPKVPDYVRLVGSKKATVDVAALTDESVDSLINEWGMEFRKNVENRRGKDVPVAGKLGGES